MKNNIIFKRGKKKKKIKRASSFLFSLLLLAEIGLGLLVLLKLLPIALFFVIHLLVVMVMAFVLYQKRKADLTYLILGFIATMVVGPMGALAFFIFTFSLRFAKPSKNTLLNDWYHRLSSSIEQTYENKKFEHVYNGRAAGLGHFSVHQFSEVMAGKNLHDKQTLLGIIALKYQPEFYPILKRSLADKEPTIRVQAAAAYTKLRTHFKDLLKEHSKPTTINMNDAKSQEAFTQKILALSSCLDSGLMETSEAKDIKAYLKMLQSNATQNEFPRALKTDLIFASLLQEDGKHQESCQLLQTYLSSGNQEVQRHYTQCLLALKQFDKLSSIQDINP